MRPDCLILDEATAMLDPRGREQVMQTIHHLNKDLGITVVSITHYMEEAAQADRVLVMSQGNVVMEGTPKEVFSQTEKVRSLRLDVPQAASKGGRKHGKYYQSRTSELCLQPRYAERSHRAGRREL